MNTISEKEPFVSGQLTSAIYQGEIRHRRFAPRENKFTYKLHMFAINVDELNADHAPHLKAQGPFGYSWFSPMRFYENDYLKLDIKSDPVTLRTRIEDKCRALGHHTAINKVVMLVQIRYLGFYFRFALAKRCGILYEAFT